SGNSDIDKIIQESQSSLINRDQFTMNYNNSLQWIPYDDFYDIRHIADGGDGSVYSAKLRKGLKWYWDLNKQDWKYWVYYRFALKELKDSRYDLSEFLKKVFILYYFYYFYYYFYYFLLFLLL